MKKVLVAYTSRTGNTEKMAQWVAEGIRFSGNTADVKKISDIKDEKGVQGYDGCVFGCPTYHRDMTAGMKTFLFIAEKANLLGKMGGAIDAHTSGGSITVAEAGGAVELKTSGGSITDAGTDGFQ